MPGQLNRECVEGSSLDLASERPSLSEKTGKSVSQFFSSQNWAVVDAADSSTNVRHY